MAKYNDLRPTRPDDSLKRLMRRVDNPQTVPHGVKVAQPDERVVFYDSSYVARTWDGDAIADFDTRISEGKAAIDAATDSLNQASQDISAARDRIAQVEADTTEEAIGSTAASQINSRRLIVGRDAILTGTVDIAQLNVTGAMSAELVKSMSSETKKLVVSEDAILNRATVVQSLVTPELVAQKVSSALITGSTIQTSANANQGVKIDSTGYKAYDSAGNLAVNLDGKNNRVVGSFATSYDDSSGVKITQKSTAAAIDLYTPNWGGNTSYQDSHAGIWFEVPSNLYNRKLNVIATDKKDATRDDPGMLLWPGMGVGFQGRFVADSPAWKMGRLTSASLAPGASADWDITFPTALTGNNPAIFPMVTNGANAVVSYVVTKQSNSGFHLRVKNTDTFATGSVFVIWLAIGTGILNG